MRRAILVLLSLTMVFALTSCGDANYGSELSHEDEVSPTDGDISDEPCPDSTETDDAPTEPGEDDDPPQDSNADDDPATPPDDVADNLGVDDIPYEEPPPFDEMLLQVREDYLLFLDRTVPDHGQTLDDISIEQYFGRYSGCDIVRMDDALQPLIYIRQYYILGYRGREVFAYKNGVFLDLYHSYAAKWITMEDLRSFVPEIAEMDLNHIEYILTPWTDSPAMDPEIIFEIRSAYADYVITRESFYYDIPITYRETHIERYYGSIGGCDLVKMSFNNDLGADAVFTYYVAGHYFFNPSRSSNPMILAYKSNTLLPITHAYIAGWLTVDDIHELQISFANMYPSSFAEFYEYVGRINYGEWERWTPPKGWVISNGLDISRIEQILLDRMPDDYGYSPDYNITHYLGNYSGCEIVCFWFAYRITDDPPILVAGYEFSRWHHDVFYAYKDSEFLSIADAYKAGWLTRGDVRELGPLVDPHFEERN